MALAVRRPLGFRPPSEDALAHRPERAPASKEAETAQFKNVLAVAVSQEERLREHGAVRRGAGYDMSDPFMVATSELDFVGGKGRKKLEFAQLEAIGLPCQVVGNTEVVAAYLGMVMDKDNKPKKPEECVMLFPNGQKKSVLRSRLLPLPTRAPKQCDWAMAVDLKGELERYNGYRCICCMNAGQDRGVAAFWVMFEMTAGGNTTGRPPVERLPLRNLVALPAPPHGALETEWEAKLRSLPNIGLLMDDPGQDTLALKDKDEDGDEDASEDLTDSGDSDHSDHSDDDDVPDVGDLVISRSGQPDIGFVLTPPGVTCEVKILPSCAAYSQGKAHEETCVIDTLMKFSEKDALESALCNICDKAKPEAELLICENFCKSCASSVHIKCLDPPLQKVPEGDWFCPICVRAEKKKAAKAKAKAKAEPKPKAAQTSAKAKLKAKVKAKAKATIAKRKG